MDEEMDDCSVCGHLRINHRPLCLVLVDGSYKHEDLAGLRVSCDCNGVIEP